MHSFIHSFIHSFTKRLDSLENTAYKIEEQQAFPNAY